MAGDVSLGWLAVALWGINRGFCAQGSWHWLLVSPAAGDFQYDDGYLLQAIYQNGCVADCRRLICKCYISLTWVVLSREDGISLRLGCSPASSVFGGWVALIKRSVLLRVLPLPRSSRISQDW